MLFPVGGEAADVGELWDGVAAVVGEEVEGAAGVDRGELGPVAGQEDLRSGGASRGYQLVEVEGGGQAGLVDDDELPGVQADGVDGVIEFVDAAAQALSGRGGGVGVPAELGGRGGRVRR